MMQNKLKLDETIVFGGVSKINVYRYIFSMNEDDGGEYASREPKIKISSGIVRYLFIIKFLISLKSMK
jgi:hypothetical protein